MCYVLRSRKAEEQLFIQATSCLHTLCKLYTIYGAQSRVRCDMHSRKITDYRLSQKSTSADEMYSTICAMEGRWSFLSWFDVNRSNFDKDMRWKRFLHFLFPVTLTYRPQFAPLVTLVQHYVSTKLEVFKAFLFQQKRRHDSLQTDRRTDKRDATLNATL